MAENARTDFFVSYNHDDKHWAEWIAWEIEAAGYSSTIQAWDFRPGSNFVLTMHNSLGSADRLIVVLSDNYLKSEYTQPEWAALFVSDPQGSRHQLLPVRVEPCPIPGLLRAIVYIDLCGKDESEARAALLAGLKTNRAKPTEPPRFPLANAPQYPAAQTPVVPDAVPVRRVKFALVLTGTVDDVNKPIVDAILEHLTKLTNDPDITFREIRRGSIQIVFECSPRSLAKLRSLVASGEVKDVAGFQIEQLTDAPDVIDAGAYTFDDFIIRADVPDLQVAPYMGALRRWLAGTAVARTQGNLAAAARLLQVDRSILHSWLHNVDTALSLPLRRTQHNVWEAHVADALLFRDTQFIIGIATTRMATSELISRAPQFIKIGSPDVMDMLILRALPGMPIQYLPTPPSALPTDPAMAYFALYRVGVLGDGVRRTQRISIYIPSDLTEVDPQLWVIRSG